MSVVTKHGAHIRMDHARALAHAAYGYGLAADLKLNSHLFLFGIGGHNGLGCFRATLDGAGKLRSHSFDACF